MLRWHVSSGPDHYPGHIAYTDPTNPLRGGQRIYGGAESRAGVSGELRRHHLGDLGGVEGGSLAQVVPAHEEFERRRVVQRPPYPPHPGRVGAHHIGGRGELTGGRIVEEDDARGRS